MLCVYKPNSVSRLRDRIVIYLGPTLPLGSSGTSALRRTRPCTGVRVLPLHPNALHIRLRPCGRSFGFRLKTSLFAPRGLLRTGVTRYLFFRFASGLCSDFPHQSCPPQVVLRLSPREALWAKWGLSHFAKYASRDAQFCDRLWRTKLAQLPDTKAKRLYHKKVI